MTAGTFREVLVTAFDKNEVKNLCQDIAIDRKDLPDHDTKSGLARSLIAEMQRRQLPDQLVQAVATARPAIGFNV